MKLMIGICSTILSYAVWYIADPLGLMWAFFLSGIASMVGVYIGWRLAKYFGL